MNRTLTFGERIPLSKNLLFKTLASVFVICWFYFLFTTRSQINWWIENILVILFIPWFMALQKKFVCSDRSLICIFIFLMLHIFGAQMSYTYNHLGVWLQDHFQLQRNPYDRIVHFSFGLLIVYPVQDYLANRIKTPVTWSYVLAVLIILALATLFEQIEWLVAACTDSETGESYVATQGDIWDAHKDIALAFIAAIYVMSLQYLIRKIKTS